MAEGVRGVLGDGSDLGVRLRYLDEPRPLGTGGALKYAQDLLDERFFMLNGDVLTDINLSAQLAQHERTGARATLALISVEDPSAYGLVRVDADLRVREFLEKPAEDQIDTNLVSAGAYVLERSVLDGMPPAGTKVSIEREVFPGLVGDGLYGHEAAGYWLDIGTPERYMQGTYDILEGIVQTDLGRRLRSSSQALVETGDISGRVVAPSYVAAGCRVGPGAIVGGRTVLGREVHVDEGAHVEGSVLLDGVRVGARSIVRGAIVAAGVAIGEHCHLENCMLGEGVTLGADNVLAAGARIFPGVRIPDGAIKF
jgi:mannose-1-phosphate guanylyltransferase